MQIDLGLHTPINSWVAGFHARVVYCQILLQSAVHGLAPTLLKREHRAAQDSGSEPPRCSAGALTSPTNPSLRSQGESKTLPAPPRTETLTAGGDSSKLHSASRPNRYRDGARGLRTSGTGLQEDGRGAPPGSKDPGLQRRTRSRPPTTHEIPDSNDARDPGLQTTDEIPDSNDARDPGIQRRTRPRLQRRMISRNRAAVHGRAGSVLDSPCAVGGACWRDGCPRRTLERRAALDARRTPQEQHGCQSRPSIMARFDTHSPTP
jgi:hypothetical protein